CAGSTAPCAWSGGRRREKKRSCFACSRSWCAGRNAHWAGGLV
ncbi:MAG: hypothetical protein AVDCRST_MAG78-680, partial [uncultured Rubrobacteraceae bacterium]